MPYKSKAQAAYFNIHKKELERKGVTFDVSEDCWECTSHKPNNNGYPAKHGETLNRFVFRTLVSEIPENIQVCHTCDNRMCINPKHLWLGTLAENQLDKLNKNRQSRLKGELNGRSKLINSDIEKILIDSRTIKEIAKDFKVSFQMVSRIKRKEAWNALEV